MGFVSHRGREVQTKRGEKRDGLRDKKKESKREIKAAWNTNFNVRKKGTIEIEGQKERRVDFISQRGREGKTERERGK